MPNSYRNEAKKILHSLRTLVAPQTIVETDASSFTHLNLDYYEHVQKKLTGYGFKFLADLEILEVSNSPSVLFKPTFIRTYASQDGSIAAAHYQLVPRMDRLIPVLLKGIFNFRWIAAPAFFIQQLPIRNYFDFDSEFDNGQFLITTNASESGNLSQPNAIQSSYFPRATPLDDILKDHLTKLKNCLTSGARAIPVHSLADSREMHNRLKQLKDAYRLSIDMISHSELRKLGSNTELSEAIFAEIQQLIKEENKQE